MSDSNSIANVRTFIPRSGTAAPRPTAPETAASNGCPTPSASDALWLVAAAHLGDLAGSGVLDADAERLVARALDSMHRGTASAEDLFAAIVRLEETVDAQLPGEFSGALTLGRAREEWIATATRMRWRTSAAGVLASIADLRETLLALADVHAVTMMPALIGGRPAQPTTLAHFLGGVIGPLGTAARRLTAAIDQLDRSPLGAGLLAGDVIAADRDALASALGFGGVVPNSLDALMSVEDFVATAEGAAAAMAPVRRLVYEVALWIRTDPTSFFIDERWLSQSEPGQPLHRVADRFERLQHEVMHGEFIARSVVSRLRDLPYAPLSTAWEWVDADGEAVLTQAAAAIRESSLFVAEALIVNRAWLGNRAGRGHTTSGDLAAFLMSEEGIQPAPARRIASLVLGRLQEGNLEVSGITQDMVDSAALLTIGREIKVEIESLGRFLAPRRFLERRQVTGSPAPDMTRAWLASERSILAEDRAVASDIRERHDRAAERLTARIAAVASDDGT